jgi:tetratricopeptide (TPR) repeat protein
MRQGVLRHLTIGLGVALVIAASPAEARRRKPRPKPQISQSEQHLENGRSYFAKGDFAKAAAEYEAAYALTSEPAILFKLGQSRKGAGEYAKAIEAFNAYLQALPESRNRAEVESAIAECQLLLPEPVVTPATKPASQPTSLPLPLPPPPPPERPGRGLRWTGVVVVGLGAILVGTGAAFGVQAKNATADINAASDRGDAWTSALQARFDEGERAETLSIVGLAAGGAFVVGGVVLYVLGAHATPGVHAAVAPTDGGAQAVVSWDL